MSDATASHMGEPRPERAAATTLDLRAALQEAVDALAGGLWDYGPGQDEHAKCNEVIARCRAALDADAAPDEVKGDSGLDDLLMRLEQRILLSHGGKANGMKHHWNLTENDSLLHKDAAGRIRKLEATLSAFAAPGNIRARFENFGRSMNWDLGPFEHGYSDCNVDYGWTGYLAAVRDQMAIATQVAPPAGWKGYVSVADGVMLKPSRHIPDGTYALVDRDAWDKQAATAGDSN